MISAAVVVGIQAESCRQGFAGWKGAAVGSERVCVLQAALDPAMPLASVPVPQLAAFSEVCLACLQMDPKDRYASLPWFCAMVKFTSEVYIVPNTKAD